MGIKGDVKSISLANVLQDLAMNEKTGTLAIRHKERTLHLWFEKGGLRLVGLGSHEGPSLLNGLLALEKIRADEAPTVTGKKTSEGGFIRGLVKRGKITREELKAALEHQMSEHLCDSFLWPEATFEFEEGEPDDRLFDVDQLDLEPRLAVDAVIMEAMRRSDEWGETRKAILSSNEILVPDPQRIPKEADSTLRRIFALLDGERSLADIEQLTRLGQFALLRAGAILIRSGAARPVSTAEAFERGRARAARKEWEAALRMARYGLDHERKNLGLLELALRAAEELQNSDLAASYARQVASAQAEAGHLEAAIKGYQKVLVHAPRDLTAHERLFSTLLQLDLKLDALAAGEQLAAAYKKAGLPDKALSVYQRLVEKLGDQAEQKFVDEEMARADGLEQHGQLADAIAALQEARSQVRRSDLNGTTQERLRELNERRARTEREWDGKLSGMGLKDVALVRDPLAVPALGKLLSSDRAEVRLAAVSALGEIAGDAAVAALLPALADRDPAVSSAAVAHLVRLQRTPLRAALLSARPAYAPGEAMTVEWRVTNLSPAEIELTLEEPPGKRLGVLGPQGTLSLPARENAGRRTVRLGPGEFVGGSFPDLAEGARVPGRYQLSWSAPVTWNTLKVTLTAGTLGVERTAR